MIRPDAPNTKPGDPGNGHVLVIDETHQKFNGQKYRKKSDGYYVATMTTKEGTKRNFLHVDVWEFHNGAKPDGYVIHHNHRNENGQWDKSANDIEHLLLLTYSEHNLYHAKYKPPVIDNIDSDSSKENDSIAEDGHAKTEMHYYIPRVEDTKQKVIRHCFFCHRPFETDVNDEQVACLRPDCNGKKFIHAYENAKAYALKEKMKCYCGFIKFISNEIQKDIRCLLIDGEFWFVARDVCAALGFGNSRQALATHVFPEDKSTAKLDTLGGSQNFSIINESGMYSLIFGSKLPSAKQFKRWVTSVLLPSLRKSGQFIITEETAPPVPFPDDATFILVDINDQPFSFSTDEREFMQKLIPAYRQMNEDDRALLAELIERNQN